MFKTNRTREYARVNAETAVVDADPHRLIHMLFEGALEKISQAKGCIQHNDIEGKCEAISRAISIIGGLQDSLKHDARDVGIADNLFALYDYASRTLAQANVDNDSDKLDEISNILRELSDAWQAIGSQRPIPA